MRTDEDLLRAAMLGYEQQLQIINGKIDVIRQELRGRADKPEAVVGIPAAAMATKGNKHRMSAEGRERIRQAQIARWKKQKKATAAA